MLNNKWRIVDFTHSIIICTISFGCVRFNFYADHADFLIKNLNFHDDISESHEMKKV